jgi:hypothetical protein
LILPEFVWRHFFLEMPVNKLSELKKGASAAPEDVVIDIEGNY